MRVACGSRITTSAATDLASFNWPSGWRPPRLSGSRGAIGNRGGSGEQHVMVELANRRKGEPSGGKVAKRLSVEGGKARKVPGKDNGRRSSCGGGQPEERRNRRGSVQGLPAAIRALTKRDSEPSSEQYPPPFPPCNALPIPLNTLVMCSTEPVVPAQLPAHTIRAF